MRKIIIAIDGHSSCGKSTMAKDLAKAIGYIYVDTGAMYRAVTLYALRHGMISQEGEVDSAALETSMGDINISFKLNSETKRPDTWLNGACVEQEIQLHPCGYPSSRPFSCVCHWPTLWFISVNQRACLLAIRT